MTKYRIGAAVLLVSLLLIVVLQNTESVETKMLFMTVTMPRAALLAVTLAIGIAAGMLIAHSLAARKIAALKD